MDSSQNIYFYLDYVGNRVRGDQRTGRARLGPSQKKLPARWLKFRGEFWFLNSQALQPKFE